MSATAAAAPAPNNAQLLQQLNALQQTVFTLTQQLNQLSATMSNTYTVNIHTCCQHGADCPNNKTTTVNTGPSALLDALKFDDNDEYTQYMRNQVVPRINEMSAEVEALIQSGSADEYLSAVKNINLDDDNKQSDGNVDKANSNELITVYLDNPNAELTEKGEDAVHVVWCALDRTHKQWLTMNQLSAALYTVLQKDYRSDKEDGVYAQSCACVR